MKVLRPSNPTKASLFDETREKRHIIFTAETHNFPTGDCLLLLRGETQDVNWIHFAPKVCFCCGITSVIQTLVTLFELNVLVIVL